MSEPSGLPAKAKHLGHGHYVQTLDSSPLWGAGRVEDTYNLVGHVLRKVMHMVAGQQERKVAEIASEAGAELVCGSSLKVALDCDWDQQMQKSVDSVNPYAPPFEM